GVAHEINTPVGIAFSCASHRASQTRQLTGALNEGALKKSELQAYGEVALESTRLMASNLSRAAELIRSFKHVAVDQTSAEFRNFDLATYLNEVITSLGPHLRTTPHRVILDCPADITLDSYPGALSQVLTNLVMNALIHAFDNIPVGTITIKAIAPPNAALVEISFSDDGNGIPAALLDKIFEPFFTTKRGAGGSGLGLHIVFNLVMQTLGGRITVESTQGQGTTFYLNLPRRALRRVENRSPDTAVSAEVTL
ncbi:MAG: HAMP domain-containing sensor histidine kinase, partial [Rhodospirillaceae bacterium]